jgi:hypothetical protein
MKTTSDKSLTLELEFAIDELITNAISALWYAITVLKTDTVTQEDVGDAFSFLSDARDDLYLKYRSFDKSSEVELKYNSEGKR